MGERGKSGIYAITCSATGKVYVGQASSIGDRWLAHRSQLNRACHPNRHLLSAWEKHGEAAFVFSVLEYCEKEAVTLAACEARWVDALKPGFNMATVVGSTLGMKHPPRSDAFRKLMSAMKKGQRLSPESIEKIKSTMAANPYRHSPEIKAKISAGLTGRTVSPEAIAKRVAKVLGRKCSLEEIAKRSAANTGKKRSAEQCARISESLKGKRLGKTHSESTKEKMRSAALGRKRPDVARALSGRNRPPHVVATLAASNDARYAARRELIREALALNPYKSCASIAKDIGVNRDTVRKYKSLIDLGRNQ